METLTKAQANVVLLNILSLDYSIRGSCLFVVVVFFGFFLDGAKEAIKLATALFQGFAHFSLICLQNEKRLTVK